MDKKEYTKLFLEQAGFSTTEQAIKEHLRMWWYTPYSPNSLRLTSKGSKFLTQILRLDNYKYDLKEGTKLTGHLTIQMSKHLSAPFYLPDRNTIVFYGQTDATMLALMAGDLASYLENFSR